MARRQDFLAYVGRAADDPNLLPMVQLDGETGPAARLLAHRQRGRARARWRAPPRTCARSSDRGELAYRAPWLTITAAGRRSLQSPA